MSEIRCWSIRPDNGGDCGEDQQRRRDGTPTSAKTDAEIGSRPNVRSMLLLVAVLFVVWYKSS